MPMSPALLNPETQRIRCDLYLLAALRASLLGILSCISSLILSSFLSSLISDPKIRGLIVWSTGPAFFLVPDLASTPLFFSFFFFWAAQAASSRMSS